MPGFRRAAVHFALVALLLRAFLPTGWMPGGPGDAPLIMCSLNAVHDTADGKEVPAKSDAGSECAFAATPALPAPEIAVVFASVLRGEYRQTEIALPTLASAPAHTRPATRAPPSLI